MELLLYSLQVLTFLGFVCLTITTPPEINATLKSNSSIILNCTFEKKDNERIRNIYWRKKISVYYEDLVDVTYNYVDYRVHGVYLINRSELLRFAYGSKSVVLIVKDVRCIDNGQYQCSINYKAGEGTLNAKNNTAVNIQGIILNYMHVNIVYFFILTTMSFSAILNKINTFLPFFISFTLVISIFFIPVV